MKATAPRAVMEVLPVDADTVDLCRLAECHAVVSIEHILFVAQDEVLATRWRRSADGRWASERFTSISDTIRLDAIGVELPMRDIYEDVLDRNLIAR